MPDAAREVVEIVVDGETVRVPRDVTVAAALITLGARAFRTSASGEARAPLCGMGICHECRLTIDGVEHRRSCLIRVADKMVVTTSAAGGRS